MRKSIRISSIGLAQATEPPAVKNFSTRFSLTPFAKRVQSLTDEQRSAISRTGFGSLLLIPNHTLNKVFLTEVMEAWNSERHAFEIGSGEIGFSLLDVALILGIPVVGHRVELAEEQLFSELEEEYGASRAKRKVAMTSLEARLDSIGEDVSDDFVRSFLLFTIGTFLSSIDGKVDSRYLSFLGNLDDVSGFAWGAAVIEDLCQWLDKRKDNNVQYVGGCLIFLQTWSYEHFDIARPNLQDQDMTFPRVCRWDHSKSHPRQRGTSRFKDLHDDQIIWKLQPTSGELQLDIVKKAMGLLGGNEDKRDDSYSASTSSNVSDVDVEIQQSISSKIDREDEGSFENEVVEDTPTRLSTCDEEYIEKKINIENLIVEDTPSNSSIDGEVGREEELQVEKLVIEDSFTNLSIDEERGREEEMNAGNLITEDSFTNLSIDEEGGREEEMNEGNLITEDSFTNLSISKKGGREEGLNAENHIMKPENLIIGDKVGREPELVAETLIVDDTPPTFSSDYDDLRKENTELKVKISQQMEEIEVLRRENLSYTQLKKENDELKKELDICKRNLSCFADRIERDLMDLQTDAIE